MSSDMVMIILQTADRTRKAQITIPRSLHVADIIKASTKRWFLTLNREYTVFNMTLNRQLLPSDTLSVGNVHNGDVLMLQPFAMHGAI
ncbi:MAG TPA: hypothetical protein VKU00_10435 [Chthonomonadaceae bacterium]|nr:hypothetical protein [Chthonomonadaceae bacterium]